jgi:uncharacterized protein YcaQ
MKTKLTNQQVRKIVLHAAGLSKRGQFGRGKEAVYKLVNHLGFIQVDTNYVVERAHHHTIAARVPNYEPDWLLDLQSEGRIFEFWTFASGFMPMDEFRYSLVVKKELAKRWKTATPTELTVMRKVLDRISREGPLGVRDFENDRVTKSKGWWDWRPSKIALERLLLDGRLVTTRRKDFQKVYDLPINVVPSSVDMTMPTEVEYARHMIRRALGSLGVAYLNEIGWHARLVKNNLVKTEIKKMAEEGEVCCIEIEGHKASMPIYTLPEYMKKKINIAGDLFILSPFDILNVFRRRLRDFFDFDYQVECFVPAPKRKYGYFSLPILLGDTFIARMDSKADRKQKLFTINNLHLEKVKLKRSDVEKLIDALESFMKFNQCTSLAIDKCNDKELKKTIKDRLAS